MEQKTTPSGALPAWRRNAGLCLALILFGAGAARGAEPGSEDPDNWPQYHRTANGWRYSPLEQITRGNVQRLSVAWIHQPGDITHGLQATPITVDGVIYYIAANNRVFAIDAVTGKEIWKYVSELNPVTAEIFFAAYSRGVTVFPVRPTCRLCGW
jgi:alcohol dehydrogenase (cytochrome c)